MKIYNVLKAMSDFQMRDPNKVEQALKQSIKKAKREKQIRKDLNNLVK